MRNCPLIPVLVLSVLSQILAPGYFQLDLQCQYGLVLEVHETLGSCP